MCDDTKEPNRIEIENKITNNNFSNRRLTGIHNRIPRAWLKTQTIVSEWSPKTKDFQILPILNVKFT